MKSLYRELLKSTKNAKKPIEIEENEKKTQLKTICGVKLWQIMTLYSKSHGQISESTAKAFIKDVENKDYIISKYSTVSKLWISTSSDKTDSIVWNITGAISIKVIDDRLLSISFIEILLHDSFSVINNHP